jgi:hypothetical protein
MDEGAEPIGNLSARESRRGLLKKAGLVGAAAWVAPTVLSGAAHAQGSSPEGRIVGLRVWCFGEGDEGTNPFFPEGGVEIDVEYTPGVFYLQEYIGVAIGTCVPLNNPSGTSTFGFNTLQDEDRTYEIRTACAPGGVVIATTGEFYTCDD